MSRCNTRAAPQNRGSPGRSSPSVRQSGEGRCRGRQGLAAIGSMSTYRESPIAEGYSQRAARGTCTKSANARGAGSAGDEWRVRSVQSMDASLRSGGGPRICFAASVRRCLSDGAVALPCLRGCDVNSAFCCELGAAGSYGGLHSADVLARDLLQWPYQEGVRDRNVDLRSARTTIDVRD